MKYYMQCIENGQDLLGTGRGYQVLYTDYKTVRGVVANINRFNVNCNKEYKLYRVIGHILDDNMELVYHYKIR